MKKNSLLSGFTLVEIMVSTTISAILVLVISGIFISTKKAFISTGAMLELQIDARLAMDWVVRDIKWADRILTSKTIGADTYTTGLNELVLNVPSIDGAGDILIGFTDTVVYSLSGTDLLRIVDPDAASSRISLNYTIANNVSNIAFDSSDLEFIKVSITTQMSVLNTRLLTNTLSSAASFRNE